MNLVKVFFGLVGMVCGLFLIWVGYHQMVGEVPPPFKSRGTPVNLASLVALGVMIVCTKVATAERDGPKIKPGDAPKPKGEAPPPVKRFRVTTRGESGKQEVQEVEGATAEEATAFAALSGLAVVSVEELPG